MPKIRSSIGQDIRPVFNDLNVKIRLVRVLRIVMNLLTVKTKLKLKRCICVGAKVPRDGVLKHIDVGEAWERLIVPVGRRKLI